MAHVSRALDSQDKAKFYRELRQEVEALAEPFWLTSLANVCAALKQHLREINWVGFYLLNSQGELVLGPFQGLPACTRIVLGKGVCGTSALKRETIVVPNVDEFPGHIVCDSASKSEIVIPLVKNQKLLGVLDIDSPQLARFEDVDKIALEEIVRTLLDRTEFPSHI